MSKLKDAVLILKDLSAVAGDLVKYRIDYVVNIYKETASNLLVWALMMLVAIFVAIGGFGFILWALFVQFALTVGSVASALIIGTILLMIAVIIFLFVKSKIKSL